MKTGFCPFAENPVTDVTLGKFVLCLLQSAVDALSTGQVQYSQKHSAVVHQEKKYLNIQAFPILDPDCGCRCYIVLMYQVEVNRELNDHFSVILAF